jgi:chemotaxis protein methyltransferase CheR
VESEYALRDAEFYELARLVTEKTGIQVSERKRSFISGRLGRRLRALGLSSFGDYCALLHSKDGAAEQAMLVNAITTNHTSFFREPHHFRALAEEVLPAITRGRHSGRLRIWSAGCSSGEEPYTIAMVLRDRRALLEGWDAKILATDLDTNMLAHASAGLYSAEQVADIPASFRSRFVLPEPDGRGAMAGELQELISFGQLNLLESWPMKGPFDIIFCRNVVIYFDKPTQCRLFDRYAELLRPDGWLFIGHSENLMKVSDRFDLVGRTLYRRIK